MTGAAITFIMIFLRPVIFMAGQTIGVLVMVNLNREPFFCIRMTIDTRIAIIISMISIGVAGLTCLFFRVLMNYTIHFQGETIEETTAFEGDQWMIIFVFFPGFGICMTNVAIARIMWLHH